MKKYILLLVIFACFSFSLPAINFTRIYHKNYDEIDRVVLVFDQKPEYDIVEGPDYIEIEAKNCVKSRTIGNEDFSDNKVLKSFGYSQRGANLIIMISLNDKQRQIYGTDYKLEHFGLEKDVFKIVLDVFINGDPQSIAAHRNYADFYNSVGYTGKADLHLKMIEEIQNRQIIPEKITGSTDSVTTVKKPVVKKKVEFSDKLVRIKKKILTFFKSIPGKFRELDLPYLIGILLLLILIIVLIIYLTNKNKKPSSRKSRKNNFRNQDGLGDEEFQKKMIVKLAENGWENEAIAKELNLKVEEVNKALKPS